MRIRLQSKLLKDLFETEIFEFDESKVTSIYLADDINVPKINNPIEANAVITDLANISKNSKDIQMMLFNSISSQLILELLKIKVPSETLRIYYTQIDYSIFNNVDLSNIESIMFGNLTAINTGRFEAIKTMEKLNSISFYNCDGLDLDSVFRDIPNPENIKKITLSDNLPTIEDLAKFTNVETLVIQNINNPNLVEEFLKKIPLTSVKNVNFINCNMGEIDSDIYKNFESLSSIIFSNCETANYNELLDSLPNPDKLEKLQIKGTVQAKNYQLIEDFLHRYTNLKELELTSLGIDFGRLHRYLVETKSLKEIVLKKSSVPNFDFLNGVAPKIKFEIEKEGKVYFKELTPDIIGAHEEIKYGNTQNQVTTYLEKNGTFSVASKVKPEELYHIQHLLKGASYIRDLDVDISSASNGINQTLVFVTPHSEKMKDGYTLMLEEQAQLVPGNIDELNCNGKLKHVVIADANNSDRCVDKRFTYNVDELKKNEENIRNITRGLSKDMPEIDRFMSVYFRLGRKIVYDYGIVNENQYSKYAKDNVDKSRNMTNGLQKGTCVCAGYADILYNCLREVGIEVHKIDGISGGYHQWNIVKIDGKYYNVDLTWDAPTIERIVKSGKIENLKYCLINSGEFGKEHHRQNGFLANCVQTYDKNNLKKVLKSAMDRDNVPYKKNLFEKVKDILMYKKSKLLLSENNPSYSSKPEKRPSWELTQEAEVEVQERLKEVEGRDGNTGNNITSEMTIDDK